MKLADIVNEYLLFRANLGTNIAGIGHIDYKKLDVVSYIEFDWCVSLMDCSIHVRFPLGRHGSVQDLIVTTVRRPPAFDYPLDSGVLVWSDDIRYVSNFMSPYEDKYKLPFGRYDKSACTHEWKTYMGFSEQFEYCVACDKKKDE